MMTPPEYEPAAAVMPLPLAAELQDHLLIVRNDLERLQRLLDDAAGAFSHHLEGERNLPAEAITAMQFHDMATQLIAHTGQRLRNCTDQLARVAFGDEDEDGTTVVETAPLRPNPVTQDEMDAGSVELF